MKPKHDAKQAPSLGLDISAATDASAPLHPGANTPTGAQSPFTQHMMEPQSRTLDPDTYGGSVEDVWNTDWNTDWNYGEALLNVDYFYIRAEGVAPVGRGQTDEALKEDLFNASSLHTEVDDFHYGFGSELTSHPPNAVAINKPQSTSSAPPTKRLAPTTFADFGQEVPTKVSGRGETTLQSQIVLPADQDIIGVAAGDDRLATASESGISKNSTVLMPTAFAPRKAPKQTERAHGVRGKGAGKTVMGVEGTVVTKAKQSKHGAQEHQSKNRKRQRGDPLTLTPVAEGTKKQKLVWDYEKRYVVHLLFVPGPTRKQQEDIFNEVFKAELIALRYPGTFPRVRLVQQNGDKGRKDRSPHEDWLKILAAKAGDEEEDLRAAAKVKVEKAAQDLGIVFGV